MPFAIAVVSPPVWAYAWLVVATAGLVYATYVPRFVIAFAGATAGTLAALGYLQIPPDAAGAVMFCARRASAEPRVSEADVWCGPPWPVSRSPWLARGVCSA